MQKKLIFHDPEPSTQSTNQTKLTNFPVYLTQSDIYADVHTLYILSVKQMSRRSHNMNVTTVGPFISLL